MPPAELREPLRFERIHLDKVWGGRALERTPGIALPGNGPIGETWELSDRGDHNSRVAGGAFAGRSLRELMLTEQRALLGHARPARGATFPLLIKLLDATQPLSVQVHPHRDTALAGEETKTECWYILAAAEDARIWFGLRPGVSARELERAGSTRALLDHIQSFPVRAGQFVFVPAGTIHALGGGITLVEVQENADLTHRLYDWDRPGSDGKPRALQLADAVRATRYAVPPPAPPWTPELASLGPGVKHASWCDADEFSVELFELERAHEIDLDGRAAVVIAVEGEGCFAGYAGYAGEKRELARGDTWLLPAALERTRIEPAGRLKFLLARTKA